MLCCSAGKVISCGRFYRDPNDHLSLLENGFAYEWAERAGRLAFQEAESPREENIVSFINLALFWYSEGEFRRSNMHEGISSLVKD